MTAINELKNSLQTDITPKDLRRLNPHLGNWNHLNEILLLKQVSTEDIKKLIIIEATGQKRMMILGKLAARLKSKELVTLRQHLQVIAN